MRVQIPPDLPNIMGKSNGVVIGSKVRDRFPGDRDNPVMEVVASESGFSMSPEGYNLYRVKNPDGTTFVSSAFDLEVVC